MKKIIGIILAVCMLSTMAFAASPISGTATASDLDTMTVTIEYTGVAPDAQATMFAYKVADTAEVGAIPAFSGLYTDIVGIDQEVTDGEFVFSVDAAFRGKIAVMVGGEAISEPMTWLVEFAEKEDEGLEITLKYGDVNGDDAVDGKDASLILQKEVKLIDGFKDQEDRKIPDKVGDVNGDDAVDGKDASLILQKEVKLIDGFKDQNENPLTTYTYIYVAPEA